MNALVNAVALPAHVERLLGRIAAVATPAVLLAARVHVGWVFLKSGWLKLSDFGSTLALFEYEYQVPLLPPALAAVAGTAGELLFGALVIVGLLGRVGALGLFAVNALAVISYQHVLLAEGFEAAFAQHVLWGTLLLGLFVTGPGGWSFDGFRRRGRTDATLRPAAT